MRYLQGKRACIRGSEYILFEILDWVHLLECIHYMLCRLFLGLKLSCNSSNSLFKCSGMLMNNIGVQPHFITPFRILIISSLLIFWTQIVTRTQMWAVTKRFQVKNVAHFFLYFVFIVSLISDFWKLLSIMMALYWLKKFQRSCFW